MLALLAAACALPFPPSSFSQPHALRPQEPAAASSRAPAAAGDPAADLDLLAGYVPTAKAPADAAIVAATDRLLAALPAIVRERGALARRLAGMHAARGDATVPSPQQPIRAQDPLLRVLVRFDDERMQQQPLEWLAPHPSAAAFPGAVPAAALPVAVGRIVDLAVPGRHSLGVYARAGEVVTVHFGGDEHALPAGLHLRIGAHSDDIARRDAWTRMPRISRTFAVERVEMKIGSAYGGLIYLDVEQPRAGPPRAGPPREGPPRESRVELLVEDAVPAPLFVLGTTTPDQWRLYVRSSPAPWAELATSKVVLTVPSEAIRRLDDPTELLTFWDRVLDGAADMATRSRERVRPERYVADVQISAGSMHSGYPIMTHLDAVADMTDVARMRKGPWGLFHELGHNHQSRDWTFAGTTEVTVNIFSLYLCHVMCDVPWDQAWGGNLVKAKERLAECVAKRTKPWGDDGPDAKPDLALRLLMYSQLERGFGWEVFFHTFAEYRDLPDAERPQTDADKRDQWLMRLSKSVDRDLGPFFAAWGVPVSDAARATAAKGREKWMPDDWPY